LETGKLGKLKGESEMFLTKKILLICNIVLISVIHAGDVIKPYILLGESGKSISTTKSEIVKKLFMSDIEILGKYSPADDPDKYVIIITHPELLKAVKKGEPSAGFLAGIRIAITKKGEMTYISCQNPKYWANAYFQEDYPEVSAHIENVTNVLLKTIPRFRLMTTFEYGSENGLSEDELRKYRYMFGMPYLKDYILMGSFDTYEAAVHTIEKNFKYSTSCRKIFEKVIIGQKLKLYGIGFLSETGEDQFLPMIDIGERKHTASMPYEILVVDNEVRMLHGRYRLALSFPDLSMKTFTKIMSISGDIEKMAKTLMK